VASALEPTIVIRRRSDGSFTVSGDQGVPAFTMFVSEGWPQLRRLTRDYGAKDHFPVSADFDAFCEMFGPPPAE
jgi:hypothetical protein